MKALLLISFLLSGSAEETGVESIGLRGHRKEQTVSEVPAIIGGEEAVEGQFTFFILGNGCGASLIHPDIGLTAAHCIIVDPGFTPNFIPGQPVTVGAYNKSTLGNAEEILVTDIVVHPDYDADAKTYNNDVAIFKLEHSVTDANYLKTIPYNGVSSRPVDGELLRTIGFGATITGGLGTPTLRVIDITKFSDTQCSNALSIYQAATQFCAGVSGNGKGICQGDSGGPIFTLNGIQVGVTSYSTVPCEVGPGGFTRLSFFKAWIDENICALSSEPPSSCGLAPTPTAPAPSPVAPTPTAPAPSPVAPAPTGTGRSSSVRVLVKHDRFSRETSWSLTNEATGAVVARQARNQVITARRRVVKTFNLDTGAYRFSIRDRSGNGICCQRGRGFYRISIDGTVVVTRRNVNWGASDSSTFTIP